MMNPQRKNQNFLSALETAKSIQKIRHRLKDIIVDDLKSLLMPYRNREIGIRLVSEQTGINEKTLKRFLVQESVPHVSTVIRFYTFYFAKVPTSNLDEFHIELKNILTVQNKELSQNKFGIISKSDQGEIDRFLKSDRVFRDIFIMTRSEQVPRDQIVKAYGDYGLEVVERMIELGIVIKVGRNFYTESDSTFYKSAKTVKEMAMTLMQNYQAEENDKDSYCFYSIERVSDLAYQRILDETREFRSKVLDIITREVNSGDNKFYISLGLNKI